MKGWKHDSYRHSLAARGIKTSRHSYGFISGLRSLQARERTGVALRPASVVVGSATKIDRLLEEGASKSEQKQLDLRKLRDMFTREREARLQAIYKIIQDFRKPQEKESYKTYLSTVKGYVSGEIPLDMKSSAEDFTHVSKSWDEDGRPILKVYDANKVFVRNITPDMEEFNLFDEDAGARSANVRGGLVRTQTSVPTIGQAIDNIIFKRMILDSDKEKVRMMRRSPKMGVDDQGYPEVYSMLYFDPTIEGGKFRLYKGVEVSAGALPSPSTPASDEKNRSGSDWVKKEEVPKNYNEVLQGYNIDRVNFARRRFK